jgi:acetylornithine/N-succinyldiaminopimelate aminotransferase
MNLTTFDMTTAEIIELEERSQLKTYQKMPIALERGEGINVWDNDGRHYFDFYGGHCVLPLGHCPPRVVEAIQAQAARLMFYSNVVYSKVRAEASTVLSDLAPEGLKSVYFCNSGTEANETALKLARKFTGKSRLLGTDGSFHGRTLGSLAVTGQDTYRKPYSGSLPPASFVPFGDASAVRGAFEADSDIAALILEPVQSMGGIYEGTPEYYAELRRLCDEFGVLLIFDEVQTGVGRTGTFSICSHYGMKPDMITLAKSLGSGIPVGAVLVGNAVADAVAYGDQGNTFGGGMMAMAAVKATLESIVEERAMERATHVFDEIYAGTSPHAVEVRGRGCLIGIELDRPAKPVIAALRERGVLTGGASNPNVIRLMPPLNTPEEAVSHFIDAFRQSLSRV